MVPRHNARLSRNVVQKTEASSSGWHKPTAPNQKPSSLRGSGVEEEPATSKGSRAEEEPVASRGSRAEEHEKVLAAGGLVVIGTERHESLRERNSSRRGRSCRAGSSPPNSTTPPLPAAVCLVFGGALGLSFCSHGAARWRGQSVRAAYGAHYINARSSMICKGVDGAG